MRLFSIIFMRWDWTLDVYYVFDCCIISTLYFPNFQKESKHNSSETMDQGFQANGKGLLKFPWGVLKPPMDGDLCNNITRGSIQFSFHKVQKIPEFEIWYVSFMLLQRSIFMLLLSLSVFLNDYLKNHCYVIITLKKGSIFFT